jgi:glutaredoxin domain-containing cysteine-rich protein 1
MAEFENNGEFSGKSNPSSFSSSSLFFNRSITFRAPLKPYLQAGLERTASGPLKRFYNPMESVRSAGNSIKGKVKQLCNIFETPKSPDEPKFKLKAAPKSVESVPDISSTIRLHGTEDRIVVYLTSLRGVRRTYEDCYAVRMIFRGFRVWVDERDVSMDSAYRRELQSVLGEKNVTLPQVFVRGKYLGGAEMIKQLFEIGEMGKILQGFPVREPGFVCDSCGDVRFVPCTNCDGSRKLFDEEEDRVKRCLECNENGLIRCPDCCS